MATASEPIPEPPTSSVLTPAFRAAQYVRMSTEHQQYSTHNQADKIQEYADRRNIQIVRTYAEAHGLPFDAAEAINWATRRGSRSGRVAWQYVVDLAGRNGKAL